ncbi:divisome protein SepX/GlpR [Phytoactinopolyspora halotolerans]|uniref:Uncharacterized protein n=1 Tax=Phytoactinopolyspora halotolerans TaxID=1981512 RepID=A0A6L9S6M9_9ACTN|nr:hypothetical protein [Phytoactinopolyspora halotolerans]NEE01125.1 hypothetical protein [Phytoactinopolyspora halotolerans]
MGYSGLIYAAIVAAWLAVLVPRWVRRNEEVERARETDAANGVRVLRRKSGPIHAPHRVVADGPDGRTIVTGDVKGLAPTSGAVPAAREGAAAARHAESSAADGRVRPRPRDGRVPAEAELRRFEQAAVDAARRRRRMLSLLFMATLLGVAGTVLGPLPSWVPIVTGTMIAGFVVVARRAAVAQTQRRRTLRKRAARERAAAADSAPENDSVAVNAEGKRIAVLDLPEEAEQPAEGTWDPVDVPLPTYVNKPKAPRVNRKIDLGGDGSWTSGRLEHTTSFELPSRPPASPVTGDGTEAAESETNASDDEMPEKRRRAVGE